MSLAHTIGFECEVHGDDDEFADDFVEPLRAAGLWSGDDNPDDDDWGYCEPNRAHGNHCGCPACAWGASTIRPMYDGTCGAELVSDPLPWPSTRTETVLSQLDAILADQRMVPGDTAGFHIHVEADDAIPNDQVLGWFAWYEYGWSDFACQSLPGVRHYNAWLSAAADISDDEPWMAWAPASPSTQRQRVAKAIDDGYGRTKGPNLSRRHETWEFRMWNSVVEAWRMHMAIEMSCAFLDAVAAAGPFVAPTEFTPLVDFVAPHMTDEGLGYMLRHLADRKVRYL